MNNDTYRDEKARPKKVLKGTEYETATIDEGEETAKADQVRLSVALAKLIRSVDFKTVIAGVLRPRLKDAEQKLKSDDNALEMYRAQGAVKELEYLVYGLPATLQALKNTSEHDN